MLSSDIDLPPNIKSAWSGEHARDWKVATDSEFESLRKAGTFELVPPPPTGTNIVGNRWVFKVKRNYRREIDRFKARLVAQGFSQQERVDFNEVFSPVVQNSSVRTL